MKVSMIDYTGAGTDQAENIAASILIFTKNTRLNMKADAMSEIISWPREKKLEDLKYMANTIPSSWEFVHYTFMIEGVTRAFTHQFVRTRTASFAQQTMRVLDVEGWEFGTGPSILGHNERMSIYSNAMCEINETYRHLIQDGAAVEDARGVLPTNILTNICVSMNMRTFVEMVRKRSSPRTQNEYRSVLDAMKLAVTTVHPFVKLFIDRTFDSATTDLDREIDELIDVQKKVRMRKLVDQLRQKEGE